MRKLTHEEIGIKRLSLDETVSANHLPVYTLCDNIRSIFNVGSIFRTSDAAMISKLFLCGYTPYPPRPEIEKVALGATKSVPWEYYKDAAEVIKKLKANGVRICSLELTDKSKMYYDITLNDMPLCMILGNELTGVSSELITLSDFAVEIPQYGFKHSMNVSVAYGIALFELVKLIRNKG